MLKDLVLVAGRLPNGIKPYTHQLSAANRIVAERKLLLSFDVGGGKTLTAILAGMGYQALTGGKVAVVAPASLQVNWSREIGDLMDVSLHSAGKIPQVDDFGSNRFFLILDEAHYYQNPRSQRTAAVQALADGADGVLPMTATPIRNYPSNMFPLLRLIDHPLGNSFPRYKERFCDDKLSGSSNLMELSRLIQSKLIIAEKEDLTDLPPFRRVTKKVQFDAVGKLLFQKTFRKLKNDYIDRMKSGDVSERGWYIVMINHLRLATAKAKAIYATKLAKKAVANGHQVVIFTNFYASANYINRWCQNEEAVLLTGGVTKPKRQALVDEFQAERAKVFVMTRAGTDGINLQKGTISISVDRTWSPFDMIQFEGRTHRNGQMNPCVSIWLQDNIVDPYIDNKMMNKYRVARQVLHGTIDDMDGVGSPADWAETLARYLFKEKMQ